MVIKLLRSDWVLHAHHSTIHSRACQSLPHIFECSSMPRPLSHNQVCALRGSWGIHCGSWSRVMLAAGCSACKQHAALGFFPCRQLPAKEHEDLCCCTMLGHGSWLQTSVKSDPVITGFDGKSFHFDSVGEFALLESGDGLKVSPPRCCTPLLCFTSDPGT